MRSLLIAILAGLAGAVILHIVIILAIPQFTTGDAWSQVAKLGPAGRFHALSNDPDSEALANADPYLRSAICVYDVSSAPVRITAKGPLPFWSLAVFDRHSNELYSMNDRSAVERQVDVTLATPLQMIGLKRQKPADLQKSILVEVTKPDGYIVLRTIAEDQTFEAIARKFLAGASCSSYDGGA
ncbi:MAG: DUF1254 domain-containing protein [Pararhizobium sp.]